MDVTFLPVALRTGAEIRAEAFAVDLERDRSGRLAGVVYEQNGQRHCQKTAAVFLCAGAIESARLLLQLGLANSSGQVGRNFMVHPSTQIWGTFDEDTRPYKGFPASLITEDPIRPRAVGARAPALSPVLSLCCRHGHQRRLPPACRQFHGVIR